MTNTVDKSDPDSDERIAARADAPPAFIGTPGAGVLIGLILFYAIKSPSVGIRIARLAGAMAILIAAHIMTFYVLARAAGVVTEQVSLNFGGALFRRRIGQTWFAINWLPLGGSAKFKGLDPILESSPAPGSWPRLNRVVRAMILLSGPAAVLLVGLCTLGPANFASAVYAIPDRLRAFFVTAGPTARSAFEFIDRASFSTLLGQVSVYFGLLNLLPLPMLNGGQAIMELLDFDPASRWAPRLQIASLFILLGLLLFAMYAIFSATPTPK